MHTSKGVFPNEFVISGDAILFNNNATIEGHPPKHAACNPLPCPPDTPFTSIPYNKYLKSNPKIDENQKKIPQGREDIGPHNNALDGMHNKGLTGHD